MKVRMLTLCAGLASVAAVMAVVVSGCCTPGNQAPIATDQNVSMTSGTTATVTVTVVDPDNAPGPLTYTLLTTPNPATEGTLHAPGNPAAAPILPTVAFTPIAGFTGCAQFTYTANDGEA
ncbi:MAG: hypothetical protein JXQ73_28430, partial [Phycisphaerae bacterium]|nr:hypothetical protein [Phycisphaerae bacterium]